MSEDSKVKPEAKEVTKAMEKDQIVDVDPTVSIDDSKTKIEGDEIEQLASEPEVLQEQMSTAFSVITAPKVCPPGYRMDATGKCRRIL